MECQVVHATHRAGRGEEANSAMLLHLLLILIFFASAEETPSTAAAANAAAAAATPSSCYDGCSGHGECHQFHCNCHPGYMGENCGVEIEKNALPILSVGSVYLSSTNFTQYTRKQHLVLVGISSHSCERCVVVESEYVKLLPLLSDSGIPFARVDADRERQVVEDFPHVSLPALYLCGAHLPRGGKCVPYEGRHAEKEMTRFVKRLSSLSLTTTVNSTAEIDHWISTCSSGNDVSPLDSVVIGFFHPEEEEDEMEEYMESAIELIRVDRILYLMSTNVKVVRYYQQQQKWFQRTPAVVVHRCHQKDESTFGKLGDEINEQRRASLHLDEHYGTNTPTLSAWIQKNSIPIIGMLLPSNFATYESVGLPMLIGFINMDTPSFRPSGVWDAARMRCVLMKAALKYRGKMTFVLTNGALYQDRMRSLGILHGEKSLPSIAMNVAGGGATVVPLQLEKERERDDDDDDDDDNKARLEGEKQEMVKDSTLAIQVTQYCELFLSGRLPLWNAKKEETEKKKDGEMKKKMKKKRKTGESHSKILTKRRKKVPPMLQNGVREHFNAALDHVVPVTTKDDSFLRVVLDETVDVVLLLHTEDGSCTACEHVAPYYKKFAQRMRELHIHSVVVARMDVSMAPPPSTVDVPKLPVIVLYRAYAKRIVLYFSGVAKVRPLMDWIQSNAGKTINYGDDELYQFNEKNAELFKQQITARENARAEQEREEQGEL